MCYPSPHPWALPWKNRLESYFVFCPLAASVRHKSCTTPVLEILWQGKGWPEGSRSSQIPVDGWFNCTCHSCRWHFHFQLQAASGPGTISTRKVVAQGRRRKKQLGAEGLEFPSWTEVSKHLKAGLTLSKLTVGLAVL